MAVASAGHMQVCTSLQTDNHASTPPLSFFTGQVPFLPPNQQRQSTEGLYLTHAHPFNSPFSRTTWVGRYQKGNTNLDFTEARDSEWQWHQLGICKSAPRSRQITMPAPHHSVFTGRMPFLPPNQQRQCTEGIVIMYGLQITEPQKSV